MSARELARIPLPMQEKQHMRMVVAHVISLTQHVAGSEFVQFSGHKSKIGLARLNRDSASKSPQQRRVSVLDRFRAMGAFLGQMYMRDARLLHNRQIRQTGSRLASLKAAEGSVARIRNQQFWHGIFLAVPELPCDAFIYENEHGVTQRLHFLRKRPIGRNCLWN